MAAWHEVRALQVKTDVLLQERDRVNRVLEAAVNMGSFFGDLDQGAEPEEILRVGARMVRGFVAFRALSFYTIAEDGLDFTCMYSDSEESRNALGEELEFLIEDCTVSWALGRNKPVIVTARDGKSHLLLHSLTTPSRVMGLCIGILHAPPERIMDVSLAFLTVVLGSTAGVLLNGELFRKVTSLNGELQEKIVHLEASERAAEAANRAKDVFLANVSHEVRTPLNGILGLGEIFLGTDLNSQQKEMMHTLMREGRVLLHLINDILDISKIDSGAFQLEELPFSFRSLMEHLHQAFQERARRKGLDFVLDFSWEGIPELLVGDPLRIRQIAANLIGNAIKFTSSGEIRFSGRAEGYREDAWVLSFTVQDSGRGMAPQELERLFSTFSQGDPAISRTYGGTGLGLVISRRLAEMMGGDIHVESTLGEGSRFTVHLVLSRAPEGASGKELFFFDEPWTGEDAPSAWSGAARESEEPLSSRGSILVVDDHGTNLRVLTGLLTKLGFECAGVLSGFDALERMKSRDYDGVFMDIRMEGMDGLALKDRIRGPGAPEKWRRIPLVAVTANAMRGARQHYLDEGFDAYISKPVSMGELRNLVERLFSSDTAEDASEDTSVFCYEKLRSRLEGDQELCIMVLQEFVASLRESVLELQRAGDSRKEIEFYAHKIRGGAENVEASRVALQAGRLEKAVREKVPQRELEESLASLEREVALFLEHITHHHGGVL